MNCLFDVDLMISIHRASSTKYVPIELCRIKGGMWLKSRIWFDELVGQFDILGRTELKEYLISGITRITAGLTCAPKIMPER